MIYLSDAMKTKQTETEAEHLGVLLCLGRNGGITGVFPCVQNDEDFELVRRTLSRLFRPSFAGLLRRLFGGQPEKR